jgi:glutathione S-transferase
MVPILITIRLSDTISILQLLESDQSYFFQRTSLLHKMANELFLWDHPISPYAQKIRIALREKNIPFNFQTPNGVGSGISTATDRKFSEGSHRNEVPILVDGDVEIFDSTIILEYIEDKYSDRPLRPANPAERARARMIEDVCDSQYEAINWAMGEVEAFKRAEGDKAAKMKEQARYQTKELQTWLTNQLGDSKWFGGESFGIADICVWPFVHGSTSFKLGPEPGTPLRKWYEQAKERESVQSVVKESKAAAATFATAVDRLKKGLVKREYRDHRLEWMIKSGCIDIVADGLEKNNIRFSWPYSKI